MIDRIRLDEMNSDQLDALYDRAEHAEAAVERARALASRWAVLRAYGGAATGLHAALGEQPGPAATQATETTPPAEPDDTLVVDRYRTDRLEHAWCFRCWGTDTCDGWLSLDHVSKESAERARDRHVAEEHTKENPMPTTPCTATIEGVNVPHLETLTCTEDRAGHGPNHIGPPRQYGRLLWTDHHAGATPHKES